MARTDADYERTRFLDQSSVTEDLWQETIFSFFYKVISWTVTLAKYLLKVKYLPNDWLISNFEDTLPCLKMPEDVKHHLNTATGVQRVFKTTIIKPVGTPDDGRGLYHSIIL